MYLVSKGNPETTNGRIPIPDQIKTHIVDWYTGQGDQFDHQVALQVIKDMRRNKHWMMCDCLPDNKRQAIMTSCYLNNFGTYYLKRVKRKGWPNHHQDCPYYHEYRAGRKHKDTSRPEAIFSEQNFHIIKSKIDYVSQSKIQADVGGSRVGINLTEMQILLFRLLNMAGCNRITINMEEEYQTGLSEYLRKMRHNAGQLNICPGKSFSTNFWTNPMALEQKRIFANLRSQMKTWPYGYHPQAFLFCLVRSIKGQTLYPNLGESIDVLKPLEKSWTRYNPPKPPFVALTVLAELYETNGIMPIRAAVQQVYDHKSLFPIESNQERLLVSELMGNDSRQISIFKPMFDKISDIGPYRADLEIECLDNETGEILSYSILFEDKYPESNENNILECIQRHEPERISFIAKTAETAKYRLLGNVS